MLVAPDCFTGTLTAQQAAMAISAGWRRQAPHDELTTMPLSDGGPGFIEALSGALDGRVVAATVLGPRSRPTPAALLLVEDRRADGGTRRTAYIESAQAAGLHLLEAGERDPRYTSTFGVGQLLEIALDEGATRIIVGLGGSGTNDGGAGLLAALGAGPAGPLASGGGPLTELTVADLQGLPTVQQRFSGIELVAATDVDNPLLGFDGASAVFGPQKGAAPVVAQLLEGALGHLVDMAGRVLPARVDLVTGQPRRLEREPGAGAAGGLGWALMLLGGHRVSGVDTVLSAVDFGAQMSRHDLVVTGEGTVDGESLRGKVVSGVARAAMRAALPCVVIAGQVQVGRREAMAAGVSGIYPVAQTPEEVEAALLDPVTTLTARTSRVAATWSPGRNVS
ncbi:MAG: glycerate kinase [Nostocoides sp.]